MKVTRSINNPYLRNFLSNIIVFCINLVMGLWITPFLIIKVGVEVYGMIPLVNQITTYFSLITIVLNGALWRFISVELLSGNSKRANKYFNTSFFTSIAIVLVFIPFLILIIFNLPSLLKIPQGHENEVQLLFIFVFITSILTFIEAGFLLSAWVNNRLDLRNLAILLGKIGQYGLIFFTYEFLKPPIWIYGISLIFCNLLSFIIHFHQWKTLTPDLSINIKDVDKKILLVLLSFGIWIVIDQIGSLLFYNTDILISNLVLGPKISGEYGSLTFIPITLRTLGTTVSTLFLPTLMDQFTKKDHEGLRNLSSNSIRLLSLGLAIPVGLLSGFAKPFLTLWLGEQFSPLWILFIIMTFPVVVTFPFQPLLDLQIAFKKVMIPAVVTIIFGLLNVALSFTFAKMFGVIGIALAGTLTFFGRTTIFTPIYATHIQKLENKTLFWRKALPGILLGVFIAITSIVVSNLINIQNFSLLVLICAILGLLYLLVIYFIILTEQEKNIINNFTKTILLKIMTTKTVLNK